MNQIFNRYGKSYNITTDSVFFWNPSQIGSSTAFTPLSIPNCILWLDGNDINGNGMNPSSGSKIATWFDKSGHSNNATQSNSSNQPTFISNALNNKGSAQFTTSSQTMIGDNPATGNPDLSVFIVFQYATTNTNVGTLLLGNQGINGGILGFTVNPGAPDYYNAFSLFLYEADYSPADTNFHYLSSIYPSSSFQVQLWIDGKPQTGNIGSTGPLNINNIYTVSAGMTGYISEIAVYQSNVTTMQRIQFQNYVAAKWAL
jgi:hypothetical protein